MLMIRHSIGSRLFFQSKDFTIEEKEDRFVISAPATEETVQEVLAFRNELNIFAVGQYEKTWYYSSDGKVEFHPQQRKLIIEADHKTVYPVSF
ncbi:hypothetical protein [Peribacillus sp. Hz7]|uniref:hypothetical protein n=1 Tax=Peribacillus sp. Hz7 TaxID=3344873 RepID=UPI0035C9CCFB